MELPDYAELRRRAGIARAEEMRRLMTMLRRFIRRAARSLQGGTHIGALKQTRALRPVAVRHRQWPARYDMSHRDIS